MARRKSVGEIVKEIEGLCNTPNIKDNGVADMQPALKKGGPGYMNVWRNEDEKIVRKMAVKAVHKKWEIVKLCLKIIEENHEIVKTMSLKERRNENVVWSEEDERNLERKCLKGEI